MRDGGQTDRFVACRPDDFVIVFVQHFVDGSRLWYRTSLDHGDITSFEYRVVPVGEEFILRLARLGKNHDAGGIAIESVYNVDAL